MASFRETARFTWPDGSSYRGKWLNGFPHGQGVFTSPDGSQYEAEWEEGKSKTEEARLKAEEEARKRAEEETRLRAEEEDQEEDRGRGETQG